MTKGILFIVGGVGLVLLAAFIYVNNDLKTAVREKVSKLEMITDDTVETNKSGKQESEEEALDAAFGQDEVDDAFNDIAE